MEERVFDRIRKLLALSRSSNEHEAASAAARAQALMAEHQIEEAQIRVDEGAEARAEPIVNEDLDATSRRVVAWKGTIANALARSLGARQWYSGGTIRLFGRTSSVRAVSYMYQYLIREVDRLADEAWTRAKSDPNDAYETPRGWKHGFRLGAASTIAARVYLQRREQEEERTRAEETARTSAALVVVKRDEEEVAEKYAEFSKGFRKVSATHSSRAGYSAGAKAGQSVSLGGGARLGSAPGKLRAV